MVSGSGWVVDGETHYQRNRAEYVARAVARKKELRNFLNEYKLERGCVDCGYREHAEALQFDHVGVKTIVPTQMVSQGWGRARILKELEQCEVRCANCHAVITAARRNAGVVQRQNTSLPN